MAEFQWLHLHQEMKWAKACSQGKRCCTDFIYVVKLFRPQNRMALAIWLTGRSSKLDSKRKWLWHSKTNKSVYKPLAQTK